MLTTLPAMSVPFADLNSQHAPIRSELDAALMEVVDSCAFIRGKYTESFEKNFAAYLGVKHCVGVGNGTDALYIALTALGISRGDEVITVANSFIASSEAITQTGARVVFVDCDPRTFTIDTQKLEAAITKKTKAIIPVHLYGQPADMDAIKAIAEKHKLAIVEDAAQAHGATYKGQPVGSLGDCACFSFFPGKNLGAFGDAGAVVTNCDALASKVRMFANHGRKDKYDHEFEGVNSRMDGIQGAILDIKLRYLNSWNLRRRETAAAYDAALAEVCITPQVRADVEHVYHLYVVRVPQRDRVQRMLSERGVATSVHYPIPLPSLGAYRYLGHTPAEFPVANQLKDEILSLPIHGGISDQEVQYVIEQMVGVLGQVTQGGVHESDRFFESEIRAGGLRRDCA